MSSFCWCIIKINENSKNFFLENTIKNNIYCIFDREKNRFLEMPLAANEIFCNIACGYDKAPPLSRKGILNNCGQFFGYVFSKNKINRGVDILDSAKSDLEKRLQTFQSVIFDIYSIDHVRRLKLYFTETANELSLSEYQHMDWKIDEISTKMSELIEYNHGLLPAFALDFKKNII